MVAVSSVVFKIKRGNLGNARKKTFFAGALPLVMHLHEQHQTWRTLF